MLRLLDHKLRRSDTDCPSGKQFYRCSRNNFRGCCSTDPCALPNCPDTADSSSPSSRTESVTKTTQVTTTTTDTTSTTTQTDFGSSSSTAAFTESGDQSNPTSLASSTALSPSSPTTSDGAAQSTSGNSLSSGAIAGIVVGVLAILAILIIAAFLIRRRRRKEDGTLVNNTDDPSTLGQKQFANSQTTGKPSDAAPSTPFGGRMDQHDNSHSPTLNVTTPELDGGISTAISELPAQATFYGLGLDREGQTEEARSVSSCTDPRATLNSTLDDSGRPVSVNYWSQYGTPAGFKEA